MQLINNIRRYKGVEADIISKEPKSIKSLADWNDIKPAYIDYIGETKPRNHPGAQLKPVVIYTNNTGHNDFHILKTVHDDDYLFFYAETVDPVKIAKDDDRLRLYIDFDKNWETGWNGYDYRIVNGDKLQKYDNNRWLYVKKINSTIEGNKIVISVLRKEIGIGENINIEYKWVDNMQNEDPLDWYINGDCAPGARFNCVYITEKTNQ